jgi:hypothetical protein
MNGERAEANSHSVAIAEQFHVSAKRATKKLAAFLWPKRVFYLDRLNLISFCQ